MAETEIDTDTDTDPVDETQLHFVESADNEGLLESYEDDNPKGRLYSQHLREASSPSYWGDPNSCWGVPIQADS